MLRLSDGNKTFANHFVAVAEGDAAPLDRQRIDSPPAAFLGNGAPLPEPPSAAIFSALEEHHRQSGAPDTDWDISERCCERCYGGERTSCWRGGDLLASRLFVFAIIVSVIAVEIVVVSGIAHACLPPVKAL